VLAAERLHGDDTTVPVLAEGKTDTGRCWIYVRDDKPFAASGRRRRCSITRAIAGRASAVTSGGIFRHPASRRLRRLWQALPS